MANEKVTPLQRRPYGPYGVRPARVRISPPSACGHCAHDQKIEDLRALIEMYEDRLALFRYELKQLVDLRNRGLA